MQKKRLDIQIPGNIHDALTTEAHTQRQSVTAIATRYITRGLSEERGTRLELQSFPLIREAIQAEMRIIQAQIRREVQAELEHWSEAVKQELTRLLAQSSSRQAALSVRALREDETTRRMLLLLAEHLLSTAQAQELYEQATQATSKHLAQVLQGQD